MFNCSASHTIRAPTDAVGELDLTTTAGTITVSGSSAEIDARTTAGDVDVSVRTDPGADRTTSASTTAGEITISNG